jgi:hypothetical protein
VGVAKESNRDCLAVGIGCFSYQMANEWRATRMRSLLALILCVNLVPIAEAATVHHVRIRHRDHPIPRLIPEENVPRGWYKFPGYPPIPAEQNRNLDPSNYGGG